MTYDESTRAIAGSARILSEETEREKRTANIISAIAIGIYIARLALRTLKRRRKQW